MILKFEVEPTFIKDCYDYEQFLEKNYSRNFMLEIFYSKNSRKLKQLIVIRIFFFLKKKQDTTYTSYKDKFLNTYVHRKKGSSKGALSSKPFDNESDVLPIH